MICTKIIISIILLLLSISAIAETPQVDTTIVTPPKYNKVDTDKDRLSKPVRRRRRPAISQQEQEFINRRMKSPSQRKTKVKSKKSTIMPLGKAVKKSTITENMQVEVVDQPVTNLFRMISKAYKVNIVPESDLNDIRVTISLEDISLKEGLMVICKANGLEMNEVDNIIYVRKASEKAIAEMNLYSKKIDINVENKPVKDFIKEFADKTKISIVASQDLEGKVSGHLKNVLPINGFKALMEGNSFRVRQKSGIYLVDKEDESSSRMRRSRGGARTNSGTIDVYVNEGKVTASLDKAQLDDVIKEIMEQAKLNMITYGELNGTVSAELKEIPVNKTLSTILQGTKYTFIVKDGLMLIGERKPSTQSGEVLSTVMLHHLKYIRADNAMKLFPKSIKNATDVTVVNEQNAILITGTAEDIIRVKEFLEQIDLPIPQVLIEVIIVEYDRSSSSEFGIDDGMGATAAPNIIGNVKLGDLSQNISYKFFKGSVKFLDQDWHLHLKANLEKNKGKVLAMPKITTLNGNKAHLQVKSTHYYQVHSYNQEGLPASDFRAIDDGITIDLTPWVTKAGDVNLEIAPSIKTSQASTGADTPPPVTDRAINTNVRLLNGQTLILGGLINSKETNNRSHVPILGHIPLLGYLFSWRQKVLSTKELVIYVTPHILMQDDMNVDLVQELEDLDSRSGFVNDKDFAGDQDIKKKPEQEKPDNKEKQEEE
ncbi:MAG: hypothetical protein HQK83_15650 [Fibrobacteria bacterium]|nr:hypothetical protein [Fibrobacteria bacterium]